MTSALNRLALTAVSDTADGRLDAGIRQPLGVADGQVLRAPVAMMDQPRGLRGPSVMDRLLEGIQNEPWPVPKY
jgi:hypothetical protein